VESAFGDGLAKALDDLTDFAAQDSKGAAQDSRLSLRAALGVEQVGGFPEFLQNVKQIERRVSRTLRHLAWEFTDLLRWSFRSVGPAC